MSSINDYLLRLQSLTKTNLEILKAINDSFHTKQDKLSVNVEGNLYNIPSFISLENKINALQANFENLVHAPEPGEAYFNFDGDSRVIEVRGYNHVPTRLTLNDVSNYGVDRNDIFKDFLTPMPYVNFNLSLLPNDITSVNVKKIIPISDELKERFKSYLQTSPSTQIDYSEIHKIISIYKEDIDYINYDTIMKLPIRNNIGTATYVIERIISDIVDVDLDEHITIKFRNDLPNFTQALTYKLFDETIERSLKPGDELVTFDSSAKLIIEEVRPTSNTIVVKVAHGEYLNLAESKNYQEISDACKLRFYSPVDFDNYKYVNVPIEEDQYIFIAIAALNDRMMVQGPWGTGVIINTDLLSGENGKMFREYYTNNVRNVGDVLYEITSMMSNTLTKYSKETFDLISNAVPVLDTNCIQVAHINKHLNDSTTIKNIRSLYTQKKSSQIELSEIQNKIDELNKKLATVSFDDTTNLRSTYTTQLSEYNIKKNELMTSITKTIDAISMEVNNAEVPIESAKYRIRGFFDVKTFAKKLGIDYNHICGIRVQYRYKNVDQEQGTAMSIGNKNNGENLFIFSDWNVMQGFDNPKIVKYESNYSFNNQEYNGNINEPSYNQIDIPISQGETVDIRLKVVYDYGRPFVETTSAWSEILNIKFPQEYLKDVQILDIVEENNNDIETNRFANIINERGIPNHINDKMIDQDITYFHRPESIASGFYTAERRIIPLKDKLSTMDTSIQELRDEVMGTNADDLLVSIVNGDSINKLYPMQDNYISVAAYKEFGRVDKGLEIKTELEIDGSYSYSNGVVSTILNLTLANTSDHTMKIYSMFPGRRDMVINKINYTKFEKEEYCDSEDKGVWMKIANQAAKEYDYFKLQSGNQILTFRIKDSFDNSPYYDEIGEGNKLNWNKPILNKINDIDEFILPSDESGVVKDGMAVYPIIRDEYGLCMDNDNVKSYITIAPKSEIIVPIAVEYKLDKMESITKTMSFDIRTSLYNDPINYTFTINAKKTSTTQDKLIYTNRRSYGIKDIKNGGWIKYNPSEIR